MEVSQIALLTLFVLFAGIFGLAVVSSKKRASLAIVVVIINAILTSIPSVLALCGETQTGTLLLAHLPGGLINVRIDQLSAWFILIINFTSINGALFGSGYLQSYKDLKTNLGFHWIFYIIFHISMVWVCMFDHGIIFLMAWELMSISSLMLVIFEYQNKQTLKAGINYMVQMHVSVVFLTAAFIGLHAETGSYNLSSFAQVISRSHSIWIFVLFFIGFAIKAGFLPFHTWLPKAHPAAPSHVSGVMSGVIVKLGIFGIFRMVASLHQDWFIIGEIILSLSVVTALFGILNAAIKQDYKQALAFCTIENIGIIGMGIGLGLMGLGLGQITLILLGFGGALLHTLNHSLFKSLLFFSAGSVYQQTHTRNIEKLGGLIKSMPKTALFFLIGAMAIGGLPPFNGFISEYLIYSGLFNGLCSMTGIPNVILIILSVAGLVMVGGISLIAFTKLFGVMFLGHPRSKLEHPVRESSFIMHLPQYLIIGVMLSVAFVPQFYFAQVFNIIQSVFVLPLHVGPLQAGVMSTNTLQAGALHTEAMQAGVMQAGAISTSLKTIGQVSFYFVAGVFILYLIRSLFVKKNTSTVYDTWVCGYIAPIEKAQYTGKSYARTMADLFGFMVSGKKDYPKISTSELYPTQRKFSTTYADIFEKYLITPLTKALVLVVNYFKFIQNGNIQSYVIYGLCFIMIVFIGTLLGFII